MMAAVRLRNAYRNKRLPDDLAGDVMDVIRDLDDVIVNTYNRFFRYGERRTRLAIKFQGEQQPNPDSRVQLSDTRDALGLPQTKLTWKLSELDRKSVDILVPSAVEVAAEQHVIAFEMLLALAEVRPLVAFDDRPTCEMDN